MEGVCPPSAALAFSSRPPCVGVSDLHDADPKAFGGLGLEQAVIVLEVADGLRRQSSG